MSTGPEFHIAPTALPPLTGASSREPALPAARTFTRLLLVFGLVWWLALAMVTRTAPVDNLEQLTWVRSLEWGYYKHPPLPTWLIWPFARLFGPWPWVAASLGAVTTLTGVALMWRLVADLRGHRQAWLAALAALCVSFYAGGLTVYNHNVVLMTCSTAAVLTAWRAVTRGQLRWWLLFGLCIGLATLSKYQSILTMAGLALFAVRQGLWRQAGFRQGLVLAVAVALAMLLPHLLWLEMHQFAPFAYARESSLGAELSVPERWAAAGHWLLEQFGNRALLALVLLTLVARQASRTQRQAVRPSAIRPSDAARDFLLCVGLTPFVLIPLMCVLTGSQLHYHWGSPYQLLLVPALMEVARWVDWRRTDPRYALQVFMLLQALMLGFIQFENPPIGSRTAFVWRNFPSADLATRMASKARRQLGGPIDVIIGPAKLAGALAVQLPEHPLVLIDGRLDRSPWLDEHRLASARTVIVGSAEDLPDGRPFGPAAPALYWVAKPPTVVSWPNP